MHLTIEDAPWKTNYFMIMMKNFVKYSIVYIEQGFATLKFTRFTYSDNCFGRL